MTIFVEHFRKGLWEMRARVFSSSRRFSFIEFETFSNVPIFDNMSKRRLDVEGNSISAPISAAKRIKDELK